MFRRARFSVRPNVGTPGKTPPEAPSATPEAGETPKDVGEGGAAATDHQSVGTPAERPAASGDGIEQHGDGTGSSAAVQRRKRFSVKPKVAPGRPSAVTRMQKSHVQAASETPVEVPVSAPQRLQSPRRRRPSEDGKQPKASAVPPAGSEPAADGPAAHDPAASGEALGAPSRPPDDVPLSLPDKEAMEISEKARTLVSSKSGHARPPPAFSLSRLLNDPSDLQRLAKAQKLRELLRREMHKEKKLKKGNPRVQEFNLDPAKMTMSDLIRYLPQSNPMTSSLEEAAQENETVVPPTPRREASPERAPEPAVLPKLGSPAEGEGGDEEEEEEEEEEEDSSMVPQVKVAEDGTLIIDEESLTVEVLRAKGPNPAQDRDPIFERGSTTTYASFRKGTYTKPWSNEETDMFFLAISMVGTDFSMICQLFALRTRSEIKNKFKKEERENSWRVDKAFRERRKLDIEYFSKLLEKIMEVHKNRKKLRSLAAKNSPKKTERKPKAEKKAARKPSVAEEGDEKEEKQIGDLEEEGEKENEDLRNEGGADAAKKKKRKRKNRDDAPTGEPDDKKNKQKQGEADVPADTEADCPASHMTESANEAADAKIKPAKLSRGKAPKPLVPLGRKRAKKPPPASTETTATDKEDQGVADGDDEDQVKSQADGRKSSTEDSEEEDAVLQPQRPTRSGRVPKPIQLLNYPAREAAPEAPPASPEGSARPKAKSTAKRRRPAKLPSSQESKKPKLVTLRASQSEYSDEEDEKQRGGGGEDDEDVEEEDEHPVWGSGNDSTAPVFVPASLRSPRPVIPEVEEMVEELDILANIPDVLGISHDALFPDASCETGAAEPCEHQLDLLVDVIDFLSSDHIEVSENENESYNEAAQTLLTIGNLAPLPDQEATQDDATANVNETSLEDEISSTPAELEESVPSDGATETSRAVGELLNGDDVSLVEAIDRSTGFQVDPAPQSPGSSKTNSPPAKKGRSSKAKPKPNLGPASRTARSQPGASAVRRSEEESRAAPPRLAPTTETPSAAEETPKRAEDTPKRAEDTPKRAEDTPKRAEDTPKRAEDTPKSAEDTPKMAEDTPKMAEDTPKMAEDTPKMTEDTPKMTEDTPKRAEDTPKMAEDTPKRAEDTPKRAEDTPKRAEDTPKMAEDTPKMAEDTPKMAEETPKMAEDTPKMAEETPKRAEDTPKMAEDTPKMAEDTPKRAEDTPKRAEDTPKSAEDTPKRAEDTPKMAEDTPKMAEDTPKRAEDTPKRAEDTPKMAEDTPKMAEDTPKMAEDTPKMAEDTPKMAEDTPKRAEETPKRAEDTPKMAEETPKRAEDTPKRAEDTPKRAEDTPKRAEDTPKRAEDTPKMAEDTPKRAEDTPKRAEETPKMAEETPKRAEDTPKMAECSKNTLEDGVSSIGVEPTEEPSGAEKTSVGEGQPQDSSEAQLEPRVEPTSGDSGSTSGSTEEAERICSDQVTSDTAVTETQLAQESSDHPAPPAPPAEEVPVTDVGPAQPTRKSRFQKVKPKPNWAQTSRSLGSKDFPPTPHPKVHEHTAAEPAVTTASSCPEVSTPEEESGVGVVGRVEPDAETSHQSVPEAQFPPRREHATRDPTPPPESSDENPTSPSESLCDDPQTTSDSGVTESLRGGSDPAPGSRAEELPAGPKEESAAASPRRRLQKVKPKPNLPQTSRTARSKRPTTEDSVAPPQHSETPCSQTSRAEDTGDTRPGARATCSAAPPSPIKSTGAASVSLCSTQRTTDERSSDVGLDSKGSEQNVPPRRQRFSRVKPNLGSPKSPRTTRAKLQADDLSKPPEPGHVEPSFTSEPQPVDDNDELRGTDCPRAEPPESGLAIAEYWSLNAGAKGLAGEGEDRTASTDRVEPGPASQRDQDLSTGTTGSNTRPTGGPSAASDVRSSGGGSALPTRTQSAAGSKDEDECEAQSPDPVQQGSEPNHPAAQSSDPSEPTDSPSRRSPQARRGRLVKPKPRLVRSSRAPPPRLVQNTKRAETGFGTEGVSDLRPDIPDPTEGALDPNSSPHDADRCPQAAGGTQSFPVFTDTSAPSSQEPSDPEEPFFILSLTEIPVCSPSDPLAGGPERLPRAPGADAPLEHQRSTPLEHQSVPGEAPPPSAVEESGEADLVWVWDIEPAASTTRAGRAMEDPVEPHASTVHPPELKETEAPEEPGGPTPRRVREPVKPETTKRKQVGKTLVAEGASTPIQTDAAGPSAPPEASVDVVGEPRGGSGDRTDVEKETPEESGAGARATRTRVTRSQNRKPEGFMETAAPPPGEAAPKGPRVRTPRAAGKRSTPAPAASAKRAPAKRTVAPTRTPNASPCPAEAPASQRSDSRKKEEPTSRKEEEPTSRKKEEPTSRKEEEPTSRKKEESTYRKEEETTSRKEEESTSRKKEESTSRKKEESTYRKEEESTSRKKEESTSRKEEEPTSREEEPTSVSQYFLCDIFTDVEEG